MKKLAILILAASCLLTSALGASALDSGKTFIWDGTNWSQVAIEAKVGYVFGMGNMADFETVAAGTRQKPCISRTFVNELKTKTVMQIVQEVDKYYLENPGKSSTPVIEVILRRCTSVCPPEGAPLKK
jgi:hypothetical protein